MKITFNITTDNEDLRRFSSSADLKQYMLHDFYGVELMYLGNDDNNIILPEFVAGLHMNYFPFWLDFYKGNYERVEAEFDTLENAYAYYGGKDKNAVISKFKDELKIAKKYGAEYVVFHVSEASFYENLSFNFFHSDEEVVDAAAEILNAVFDGENSGILLLTENLWQSGFTFTRPEITKRLLDKIQYKNKGIMLDTGHLMHTDTTLKTQEDGLAYILKMLDEHGELCRYIKGVHLHQSVTSEYINRIKNEPPALLKTYGERTERMFIHAFETDRHKPFTADGVDMLIKRISPEYLTLEFMTASREEHSLFLRQQLDCLFENGLF